MYLAYCRGITRLTARLSYRYFFAASSITCNRDSHCQTLTCRKLLRSLRFELPRFRNGTLNCNLRIHHSTLLGCTRLLKKRARDIFVYLIPLNHTEIKRFLFIQWLYIYPSFFYYWNILFTFINIYSVFEFLKSFSKFESMWLSKNSFWSVNDLKCEEKNTSFNVV